MDEYISKQAIISKFNNCDFDISSSSSFDDLYPSFGFSLDRVEAILNSIPSASVREDIKGKWIECIERSPFGSRCIKCSNCGYKNITEIRFNFCPVCGARMIKRRKNSD